MRETTRLKIENHDSRINEAKIILERRITVLKIKLLKTAVCFILVFFLFIPVRGIASMGEENDNGACTAFYMGKGVTENGSFIWGRTEDISASYRKLFAVHEAETHVSGDMFISGTYNSTNTIFTEKFKWPYPVRTLRYILCKDSYNNEREYPEPYAEVGINEKNVAISATVTISGTKSTLTSTDKGDPSVSRANGGLAEVDLASVVLMQAETARGACELVAKIIDTVGASGREGFMVSDPNEVWYFQWLSGKQYVAVKCPHNMIGFSPNATGNVGFDGFGGYNGYLDVTDRENVIASPGLISVPIATGDFIGDPNDPNPSNPTRIRVCDTYASAAVNQQTGRYRVGYGYLYQYTTNVEIAANFPSSKYLDFFREPKTGKKYSLYEAMKLLACRGEGTEWEVANPTGNGSSIANAATVEAHVFEVRPNMPFNLAQVEWLCLAPTEFGVYLPYYGNLVTKVFEKCYTPDVSSYNNSDPNDNSMYNVFRELYIQCAASTIPERERLGNGVRSFWEKCQKLLINQQAYIDKAMVKLLQKDGLAAAEKAATDFSMKLTEQTYDCAKQILAELKAFKTADVSGDFVPSLLSTGIAIPIKVSGATGKAKDEVTLTVSFENNPGIASFSLTMRYPDVLEFVSAKAGDIIGSNFKAAPGLEQVTVSATSGNGADVAQGKVLFTINFKIAADAKDGAIGENEDLSLGLYWPVDGVQHDGKRLNCELSQGEIVIDNSEDDEFCLGCNAGFGFFAIVFMAFTLALLKKR